MQLFFNTLNHNWPLLPCTEELIIFASQISSKAWEGGIHESQLEQTEKSQEKLDAKLLQKHTEVYAQGVGLGLGS